MVCLQYSYISVFSAFEITRTSCVKNISVFFCLMMMVVAVVNVTTQWWIKLSENLSMNSLMIFMQNFLIWSLVFIILFILPMFQKFIFTVESLFFALCFFIFDEKQKIFFFFFWYSRKSFGISFSLSLPFSKKFMSVHKHTIINIINILVVRIELISN